VADRVTFTKGSAERIAQVVRIVEAGNRDTGGLPTAPRFGSNNFQLNLATFTGNWQTGEYKVVTLQGSTNTASVYNWCNPALGGDTASSTDTRFVIFGKVQGTQSAVEIQMRTTNETCSTSIGGVDLSSFPGYLDDEIQLLGHNESACLQWYSITTCATATAS
jgi:hypothetical protein